MARHPHLWLNWTSWSCPLGTRNGCGGLEGAIVLNPYYRIYFRLRHRAALGHWRWKWEPGYIEYCTLSTEQVALGGFLACPSPSWGVRMLRFIWPRLDQHLTRMGV